MYEWLNLAGECIVIVVAMLILMEITTLNVHGHYISTLGSKFNLVMQSVGVQGNEIIDILPIANRLLPMACYRMSAYVLITKSPKFEINSACTYEFYKYNT